MDASSPRILIVRLSAIGDVVHTLPVLDALRERFPASFLAWTVDNRAAPLLAGHPALDELIVVQRRWMKSPLQIKTFWRRCRSYGFDVTIDVQGLTKSALAAWLSGSRHRIGFAGPDGREFSRRLNNDLVMPAQAHVVERNLELLSPLGISATAPRFRLPCDPAAENRLEQALRSHGISEPFALINPSAGWPSKLWPCDRFANVARHLHRYGMPSIILWAGNEERQRAEKVVAASSSQSILAPATSLQELIVLCRKASIFVSSDTGPLHIAAAVGTPCVGLYGPMPASRNGPYGEHCRAIQMRNVMAPPKGRRKMSNDSMMAIDVESVLRACDELLQNYARIRA